MQKSFQLFPTQIAVFSSGLNTLNFKIFKQISHIIVQFINYSSKPVLYDNLLYINKKL